MDPSMTPDTVVPAVPTDNISLYISIAITAVAALFVLFGVLFGLKRGFSRSVVRLVTVALSALGAYFIAASLVGTISGLMSGMTLLDLADKAIALVASAVPNVAVTIPEQFRNLLASFDTETTLALVNLTVALVLVPIVFVTVFTVLRFVTLVVYWIITAIAGMRKRRTKATSRIFGALIGGMQGAILAAALLLPLSGFASVAVDCRAALTSDTVREDKRAANEEFFAYWLDDITSNPVLSAVANIGGRQLFDNMTAIPMGDVKTPAASSVKTLLSIYTEAGSLAEADPMAPSEEMQTALENAVDILGADPYTATVAAGLLRGVNTAVDSGALVIVAEEPMASFVGSIIDVFADSSKDNLEGDIDTVLHVYFILADNGVLNSFGDANALRDALILKHTDGKTVIDYVVDELYANPRTAHIVNSLTEMSIKIMCESIGLSDDAAAVYANVKTGINGVLALNEADYGTREEYVAAVSVSLNTTLTENDIVLDEATLDAMSNYIADNYSDTSEITDEDINRALLSYYGAYAENGETPEGAPEISEG